MNLLLIAGTLRTDREGRLVSGVVGMLSGCWVEGRKTLHVPADQATLWAKGLVCSEGSCRERRMRRGNRGRRPPKNQPVDMRLAAGARETPGMYGVQCVCGFASVPEKDARLNR